LSSKKIMIVKQIFALLSFFMVTEPSIATENPPAILVDDKLSIPKHNLCDVSSRYGIQAFNEKTKSPDLNLVDSFTLIIYGLKKSDALNVLNSKEQEIFVNFIWGTYEYVYSTEGLTSSNISDKVIRNCEDKKKVATEYLSKNIIKCQVKGRLYESIGKHRAQGDKKEIIKVMYAGFLKRNPVKYNAISTAIDFVYDDEGFKTASYLGRQVYESCLVE